MSLQNLYHRRSRIESRWARFNSDNTQAKNLLPQSHIASSWQRSAVFLSQNSQNTPIEDKKTLDRRWQQSQLREAITPVHHTLSQMVEESHMVAAIADASGRLLWTSSSNHMRTHAESVNFMPGAHWDERSVGTNAVGLALTLAQPVTVFSSEHYLASVHDWVCYAAPIVHPETGDCMGVLDISTTWKRHTPLGQAAATGMAHSIALALPKTPPRAVLEIHALGKAKIVHYGKELNLPQRQIEILCLLALNPEGLSLEQFHAALYGDSTVSASTLKSELSQLRRLLNGKIGSRPYRLQTTVWADFIEIWQALQQQQADRALSLYRGPLTPQSSSPELEEWRCSIDAVMEASLNNCDNTAALIKKLQDNTNGSALIRERLSELLSTAPLMK